MKKFGFIIFFVTLAVGVAVSFNFGFNPIFKFGKIKGSGNVKTDVRNLSGFNEVKVQNAIEVEIAVQKDYGVTVEADDNLLQNIVTEVNGDVLEISTKAGISTRNKLKVTISMPELANLEVSGASSALVSDVKSDSLEIQASGASKIKISGTAENLKIDGSGASNIDAEFLQANDVDAEVSGASKATVSASNNLNAEANGASKLLYTGEPAIFKQNSSGASSVKRK